MKKHVVLILVLLALLFLTGCGASLSSESDATAKTPNGINATPTPVESLDVGSEDCIYQIGDTVTYDGLEVTVKEYLFSNNLANVSGGAAPGSNNKWCVVYVDVKNTTTGTIALRSSFNSKYGFSLVYDNDYSYYATFKKYNDFFESYNEIKPLETISATTSFELPNDVISSDNEIVVYFSKNKADADKAGWLIRDEVTKAD